MASRYHPHMRPLAAALAATVIAACNYEPGGDSFYPSPKATSSRRVAAEDRPSPSPSPSPSLSPTPTPTPVPIPTPLTPGAEAEARAFQKRLEAAFRTCDAPALTKVVSLPLSAENFAAGGSCADVACVRTLCKKSKLTPFGTSSLTPVSSEGDLQFETLSEEETYSSIAPSAGTEVYWTIRRTSVGWRLVSIAMSDYGH